MAGELSLDLSPTITGLNNTAAAARNLTKEFQATAEVGKGAFAAAAQSASEAKNRFIEQVAQAKLVQESYKSITAAIAAQRQAERELIAERNKPGVSTQRQEELKKAIADNIQQQQVLRQELARTKELYAQVTESARGASGGSSSTQAKNAIEVATQALRQRVEAEAAARDAAAKTALAYQQVSDATKAAVAENSARIAESVEREKQIQAARQQDLQQLASLKEAEKELRKERSQTAPGVAKNDLQVQINANIDAQRTLNKDIAAGGRALEREKEIQKGLATQSKQAATAQSQAGRENTAAQKQVTQAARETVAAEKQVAVATREAARAAKEQAAAAKVTTDANVQIGKSAGGFLGTFKALGAAAAAAFSIAAVKQFVGAVTEASKEAERLITKLTFANGGNREAGARELNFLRAEVNRLGLDLNSAGASYANFIAAATQSNVPLTEARRTFLAIAGASATLKLSASDTEGALRALQQMVSKGTVSAEELRGQLGERLPGAFAAAARAVGVTEKELGKMLQRGELIASDFLPKFTRELEKTFGDGTEQAADSIEANTNRINNEWQAFLQRFEGLAGGTLNVLARFSRIANRFLDSFSTAGRLRQATAEAQQGIKDYGNILDTLFEDAKAKATKNGASLNEAVDQIAKAQTTLLTTQLAAAEKAFAEYDVATKRGEDNIRKANIEGRSDDFLAEAKRRQQRVELLKGEIALIAERAEANKKANDDEAKQLGVIEALRQKIKKEKAELEQLGPGEGFEKARQALVAQIALDEKELDRLLGKVQKTVDKLTAALKALQSERLKLQKEYDQAELASLKDQGQAKAAEQLRQDNQSIAQLEKTLKEREAAVRKAGGRGANADGIIDGVQQEQLNELRRLALEKFNEELNRIGREYAAKSLELQRDSDEKEIAQLRAKFAEEIRIAEEANESLGNAIERAARDGNETLALSLGNSKLRSDELLKNLRAAAQEQEGLLRRQQALNAIDREERARIDGINSGNGVPIQQFTDVTADQSAAETNAAAERLNFLQRLYRRATAVEVDLEKERRKAILKAQIETNDARLLQYQNDFTEQGIAIKAALEAQNKQYLDEFGKLRDETQKNSFSFYKLLLGKDDSDENREILDQAVGQIKGALDQIVQANLQAAQQVVDARQRDLDDLNSKLLAEIALRKEGSASNVQATLDEIKAARQARNQALKEQRQAQRQQAIINGLSQISSIASASAKIIEGWSSVPFVGSLLGLAAVGAMIAAFTVSQTRAKKAIESSAPRDGFFKGGYTGGGSIHEERGPVHGKEFVFTHKKTEEHYKFFDALHNDKLHTLSWQDPTLRKIKDNVEPNPELPAQLLKAKNDAQKLVIEHQFKPLQAQFEAQQKELEGVRKELVLLRNTKRWVETPGSTIMEYDPETNTTRRRKV